MPNAQEYLLLAPEILLAAAGLLLLLAGAVGRGMGNRDSALVTVVSLALTAGVLLRVRSVVPGRLLILGGSFVLDGFSFYVKLLVLVATALTVLLSIHFLEEGSYRASEYYALLLLATSGMLFMAADHLDLARDHGARELRPGRLLQARAAEQ